MRTAVICIWLLVALCAIATTTQAYRPHNGIQCYRIRGRSFCVRYGCRYYKSGGRLVRACGRCYRYKSGRRWRYRCRITSRKTINRSYTTCLWQRYYRGYRVYRRRVCIRCTRFLVRGRYLRTRCRRV